MNPLRRTLGLAALIAVAATALITTPAAAADVLKLKDGTEVVGEIQNEVDGWIWIKRQIGEIERVEVISPDAISEIQRDTAEPAPEDVRGSSAYEASRAAAAAPNDVTLNNGTPRGAVVTLEGMVGMQFAVSSLQQILPDLERELGTDGSGILVLKINSGGGLGLEVGKLNDFIQQELKPRFRVVAWIESAISAAAMTSHVIEEIYFMPEGNYGACTGWRGALENVEGRELEEYLAHMERISALGGHDYRIMRAMQIEVPLSATVDESGQVAWFLTSDSGQEIVNPAGKILTFNSLDATRYGFSGGTARTISELQTLMGVPEIEWVGRHQPGELFPISRAEEKMRDFRARVTRDEEQTNVYFTNYQQAIAIAESAPVAQRGPFVGRARTHLDNIKRMIDNNPNFRLLVLNMNEEDYKDWIEAQERMLRDLLRG